jgi:hypothetical protein
MRQINVTDEVWEQIAKRGKFGETEDDVLRRVFDLPPSKIAGAPNPATFTRRGPSPVSNGRRRRNLAKRRMSSYVNDDTLHVSFAGGANHSWPLPRREDKAAIRSVRDQAVEFARMNGATFGQENAVKKALTEAGFHLMK